MNRGKNKTEKQPFEMLEELLWQDQFELIFPEGKEESEIRLVYLMNDAVESFLVFINAKMTGQYQSDYEGELEAELSREEREDGSIYVLVVHQGDDLVTLLFEDLKMETHLYRYGDLGHFWVKGYEYLRQLEYRLAILHSKCEYLGEDAASEEERKLAELVHFPPLNYACYPAVPQKYIVPMEDVWEPTEQAISVMEGLAAEAEDRNLLRWLAFYRRHHGKGMSKLLAWKLHRVRHRAVVKLLMEKLMQESERYPVRSYESTDRQYEKILVRAELRKEELESQGKEVTLVREEPFTRAQDSIEYNVYLMIWRQKMGNLVVEVEKTL